MRVVGHEPSVPAGFGGVLAGGNVSSPVRDRRLDPESRRSTDVPQVQRFRLGCSSTQPRNCCTSANSRNSRHLESQRSHAL